MKNKKKCILFFVKYPEQGNVKTRLSSIIGEDITVELYRNFILDMLDILDKIEANVCICFHPGNHKEKFLHWLGPDYFYKPQKGKDLGERMKNAFKSGFEEGYEKIIILGSDTPDLPKEIIEEAFRALDANAAVIGPSVDGGYYLIGFGKDTFLPEIFQGIEWSTDSVFSETINILKKVSSTVHILPCWQDIDTITDLKSFFKKNQNSEFSKSKTIIYIKKKIKENI
ncbi:MAG: TIGR04282 family arsenosugar biosynthesis glycosyltransferase [Nitrosopumilus sp.]